MAGIPPRPWPENRKILAGKLPNPTGSALDLSSRETSTQTRCTLPVTRDPWGPVRPSDAIVGLQHSDLNTNNILAKFAPQGAELEGYFLIDFALFKEKMPLLYDQRYLEMSYLVHALSQGSMAAVVDLITRLGEHEILEAHQAPVEMAGVNGVIRAGRLAFGDWVRENHPTLHDDLWGQYWLAGAAAGLSYCHKAGQAEDIRPRRPGLCGGQPEDVF